MLKKIRSLKLHQTNGVSLSEKERGLCLTAKEGLTNDFYIFSLSFYFYSERSLKRIFLKIYSISTLFFSYAYLDIYRTKSSCPNFPLGIWSKYFLNYSFNTFNFIAVLSMFPTSITWWWSLASLASGWSKHISNGSSCCKVKTLRTTQIQSRHFSLRRRKRKKR